MKTNQLWIRVLGIFGILGGLILFAGDMLFYYDPESKNMLQNMGNVTDFRITASGVSALIAAWFYMLGAWQVYYAFKPTKTIIRNSVLICFGGILIAYGVIHGAYIAIATSAKLAIANNLDLYDATLLAQETNLILRLFVYPLFGVLSILFISQVWKKKTLYPRWIILFYPLTPFLLEFLIPNNMPIYLWIIIKGGFLNLILVLFFTASTIALWNSKTSEISNK